MKLVFWVKIARSELNIYTLKIQALMLLLNVSRFGDMDALFTLWTLTLKIKYQFDMD